MTIPEIVEKYTIRANPNKNLCVRREILSCDLFELSRTLYKMSREKGFADTPASLLRELFLQFTCTYCQYGFERRCTKRKPK